MMEEKLVCSSAELFRTTAAVGSSFVPDTAAGAVLQDMVGGKLDVPEVALAALDALAAPVTTCSEDAPR